MGYNTNFKGTLEFTTKLPAEAILHLEDILGEDVRDYDEWQEFAPRATYIDLKLNEDHTGIKWNGAEKTYEMVDCINLVTRLMRIHFPDFKMTGTMLAQGEEAGDIWQIVLDEDGYATQQEIELAKPVIRGTRRVVCAANRNPLDTVVLGARHHDTRMNSTIKMIFGNPAQEWEQGFIDQFGVFMNRQEAWKVAETAGQIIYRCGGDAADGGTLYSENLY